MMRTLTKFFGSGAAAGMLAFLSCASPTHWTSDPFQYGQLTLRVSSSASPHSGPQTLQDGQDSTGWMPDRRDPNPWVRLENPEGFYIQSLYLATGSELGPPDQWRSPRWVRVTHSQGSQDFELVPTTKRQALRFKAPLRSPTLTLTFPGATSESIRLIELAPDFEELNVPPGFTRPIDPTVKAATRRP